MKGSTTYLPNAKGRAAPTSTIAAVSAACRVLLFPTSHIAETASKEIKVIIMPPALCPMDAMPPAAARTKKTRKKAAALAPPAVASNDALATTPTLSTAPTTKKGKTTGNKKATEPIDLCAAPMWAKTTNSKSHCVMAITHGQKLVVGNASTINGDVANKLSSGCQWYKKGPSGKRIMLGNPDFADMSWGRMRPTNHQREQCNDEDDKSGSRQQ